MACYQVYNLFFDPGGGFTAVNSATAAVVGVVVVAVVVRIIVVVVVLVLVGMVMGVVAVRHKNIIFASRWRCCRSSFTVKSKWRW